MSTENGKTPRTPDDVTRGTRTAETLAADLSMSGHALPAGTQLQDYVITGLLGEGGFGIVYLAEDAALQREVALKEYLPSSMASRAKNAITVMVKSANHQETFALGLKSFVNEARLLARFDHSALVKVHRFWEANGTAYMVMPYYRGPTLKAVLQDLGHLPDEAEVRRWLWPLMDALAVMHAAHCFHRDIAPDNILITENGPLLLDFGAARRVIGDMTHALTVVLKPGFAPIEQYGDIPGMTQGAWTDIYALASVLYTAISGKRPMPSVERLINDQLQPLTQLVAGRQPAYPAPFLQAIDQALSLRPTDRPQSIEAFRALLERREAAPAPAPPAPVSRSDAYEKTVLAPRTPEPSPVPRPAPGPVPGRKRPPVLPIAAGAISVLVLAAAGYGLSTREPAAAPTPAAAAVPAPAPAVVPAVQKPPEPAPAAEPAPATSPATQPEPEPAAQAASGSSFVPAPEPAPPAVVKREARPAPKPVQAKPPVAVPADSRAASKSAEIRSKCSDILQKASLETLSASEQAFLRKECR